LEAKALVCCRLFIPVVAAIDFVFDAVAIQRTLAFNAVLVFASMGSSRK
jgi:hypothetical protein